MVEGLRRWGCDGLLAVSFWVKPKALTLSMTFVSFETCSCNFVMPCLCIFVSHTHPHTHILTPSLSHTLTARDVLPGEGVWCQLYSSSRDTAREGTAQGIHIQCECAGTRAGVYVCVCVASFQGACIAYSMICDRN